MCLPCLLKERNVKKEKKKGDLIVTEHTAAATASMPGSPRPRLEAARLSRTKARPEPRTERRSCQPRARVWSTSLALTTTTSKLVCQSSVI